MTELRRLIRMGWVILVFEVGMAVGCAIMCLVEVHLGSVFWSLYWTALGVVNTRNMIKTWRSQMESKQLMAMWIELEKRKRR